MAKPLLQGGACGFRSTVNGLRPTVIIITGPTGAGKSEVALRIARQVGGEIVLLDLRLAYPGLKILGAGPSSGDSKNGEVIEHIVYAPGGHPVDPFFMAEEIQNKTREILKQKKTPIWSSGAHLLLSACMDALEQLPASSPRIKERIRAVEKCWGPQRLHQMLHRRDPQAAARIHPTDSPRLVRALGLAALRGAKRALNGESPRGAKRAASDESPRGAKRAASDESPRGSQSFPKVHSPGLKWKGVEFRIFGLVPDALELKQRLRRRLDRMIDEGALDEVRNLDRCYTPPHPVRTSHGFSHLLGVIQGDIPLSLALDRCLQDTVSYTRRQKNYMKRFADMVLLKGHEAQPPRAAELILEALGERT